MTEQVATRVTYWRKRAGFSQKELAERVGVHPSTVTRWEQGRITPTLAKLEMIADAVGVEFVKLLRQPRLPKAA